MSEWPRTLAVTYLVYILFWESLIIGGTGYVVFVLNHSGWWFLLAVLLTGSAYLPHRWYELYTGVDSRKGDD